MSIQWHVNPQSAEGSMSHISVDPFWGFLPDSAALYIPL